MSIAAWNGMRYGVLCTTPLNLDSTLLPKGIPKLAVPKVAPGLLEWKSEVLSYNNVSIYGLLRVKAAGISV
jgi:hypothetical protein